MRVRRTVAPSASQPRAQGRATRQVNVASGKPPLVAVPVVLHGFHEPDPDRPVDLARGGVELPSWWPGSMATTMPARGSAVGDDSARGARVAPAGATIASTVQETTTTSTGSRRTARGRGGTCTACHDSRP